MNVYERFISECLRRACCDIILILHCKTFEKISNKLDVIHEDQQKQISYQKDNYADKLNRYKRQIGGNVTKLEILLEIQKGSKWGI